MAEPGVLTVVATPIGNLGDLSPRAAEALRSADLVACEDSRRTATLLRHVGSSAPMLPTHEHNEAARAVDLVARLRGGAHVVLVSDAGMPVVSDPGGRAIAAAIAAGITVTVIPGPSAVETALVLAGLPADAFTFIGFFPRTSRQRREVLERLGGVPGSVVGFESPHRLAGLLADLAAVDPDRPVAVCRELTKLHEEVVRGTAAEVAQRIGGSVRGEVTVVLGPAPASEPALDPVEVAAVLADAGLGPRAIGEVAARLGLASRNAAYRAALAAASRNST